MPFFQKQSFFSHSSLHGLAIDAARQMQIIIIPELERERVVFQPAPAFFAQAVPEKRFQPLTAEHLSPAPRQRLVSFELRDFDPIGVCLLKNPEEELKVLIFGAAIVGFRKHYPVKYQPDVRIRGPFLLLVDPVDARSRIIFAINCKYDPFFFPTVIYNPLTLVPGRPSNGTTKRFLAIGRFSHYHKGFDVLIKAFNLFTKNDKEWILDIVGEGPEKDLYCKLIQQYNLEERIKIHPFTHDVQSYYSNGQIYVLSSRWEGFGLVLVEAMAHGLPVISSDIPTSKEILGDFGMYFKNGDAHDLGCKLQEATLLNWKEKSQQAKEIALRFDIKHIIEQWKQLIEL